MPRLKVATDANGTKFYPISISKGIWDIDNNQRLSTTLTSYNTTLSNHTKDIGIIKASNISEISYDTSSKYLYYRHGSSVMSTKIVTAATIVTDGGGITSHLNVNLASGTNNGTLKLTVGSTATDNIPVKGLTEAAYKEVEDTPTENSEKLVTSDGINFMGNTLFGLLMLIAKTNDATYSTTTITTNPEFYIVVTDSEDKIIAGLRKDGSYVGLPYMEAIETIMTIVSSINNS